MKYIKLLILFAFCYGIGNAQPIINRSSSANTISDARLQGGLNLYVPRYSDTTASLAQKGIDSTGAIIYTYTPNGFWVRKANPKRWVRISDADVTTTYAAGFGLLLNTNTFSVDSIAIATRGRLYKVVDSSIRANRQGLASVLTVSDDADGRGIYNLSSLFSLDTLNTSGVFQLGYGAYTMSFPRTLTANRTMIIPDASDTLAGRTWVRDVLAGFTPTTPDLQTVTGVGNTTTNDLAITDGTSVVARLFNNAGEGALQVSGGSGSYMDYALTYINASDGFNVFRLQFPETLTGSHILRVPDVVGTLATEDYADGAGAITLTTTGSSGAATWDAGTRTLNIPEYSGGGTIDTTDITTRLWLYKTIDSMKVVNAATFVTQAGARTSISLTTTGTSGAATYNNSTGVFNIPQYVGTTYSAGVELFLSGTTFNVDTTSAGTRLYAQKVGDSTYARATATVASTYVPLTRTVTPNAPLFGGGALSSNITVSLDTTTVATRAYAQKIRDSMNVLLVHISGTETITGDKTFSGVLTAPTINGSTAANGSITIQGTSNSTRTTSYVNLQPTAGLVGIGTTTPFLGLDINNTVRIRSTNPLYFGGTASAGDWKTNMFSSVSGEHTISANGFLINNAGYGALTFLKGLSTGEIGVGVTAPTARLHLPAGAAAAQGAPLKFTSGTNLTTPESGSVEFNGTDLFFTNSTANRYTLARFITTGTAPTAGTATFSSGTVTVSTTAVAAGSIIEFSYQNCSNCGTAYKGTITAGTSFVITSSNVLDGSIVSWRIIY